MHVLAMHIRLVNLSRQIKVQNLYGKKTNSFSQGGSSCLLIAGSATVGTMGCRQ